MNRPAACGLQAPQQCRDTNQLSWSPGFANAVRHFIGAGGDKPADLADNVLAALGGPADPPATMFGADDGGWLFSACVAHMCPIKGALLLDRHGRPRAAAVFDLRAGVGSDPRLDIILRHGVDVRAQALLTRWAAWTIAQDRFAYADAPWLATRISGIRIYRAAE